ncbi:MAG TPA: WecB/TagA/CpsF family glycosyltransferase, partial [Longimicrobium sp.]|nr:WecB/TagA/CpsF family glycosyltransferase [Longimicrobium sp.]
ERGPPVHVVTPNAQHIVLIQESPHFRGIYETAWLVVADGMSLVWASRLLGDPLPERVGGVDLFEGVCAAAAPLGLRIFLLGGRPGAADAAARILRDRYPGLVIAGTHCPPLGFETDPVLSERAVSSVRDAAPDILFVALGAPKQEFWIDDHALGLGVPVSAGVGGAFELVAGIVRRAPKWMQRSGMEWVFRMGQEPRRLWKRYALTNPRFVRLALRQYMRSRRAAGA